MVKSRPEFCVHRAKAPDATPCERHTALSPSELARIRAILMRAFAAFDKLSPTERKFVRHHAERVCRFGEGTVFVDKEWNILNTIQRRLADEESE